MANLKLYNIGQIELWLKWEKRRPFKKWIQKYSDMYRNLYNEYSGNLILVKREMEKIENGKY